MQTNSVRLIGYVGVPPKIKVLPSGTKVGLLKVATHYRKYNPDEKDPEYLTDWHYVIGWDEQASYMEKSFVTGSKVLVEGRISYRGYTNKAGVWIKLTDIQAESIMNLDR